MLMIKIDAVFFIEISFILVTSLLIVLTFVLLNLKRKIKITVNSINCLKLENDKSTQNFYTLIEQVTDLKQQFIKFIIEKQTEHQQQREQFNEYQIKSIINQTEGVQKGISIIRGDLIDFLKINLEELEKKISILTNDTNQKLIKLSEQVENILKEGFIRTNTTYENVIKKFSILDTVINAAQKNINELAGEVVGLQAILSNKQARGVFGEVQLETLVSTIFPKNNVAFQQILSNGNRVDCLITLPSPAGYIAIDAKFPLETYRKLISNNIARNEKEKLQQTFKQDIKRHILDIAVKYIIVGETDNGALMFIPSEAIFVELYSNYSDLIDFAYRNKVWIVSPTTIMFVLTIARAVVKHHETKEQINIIQQHLIELSKDFLRFEDRIGDLAKHITLTKQDIDNVQISSRKICSKFKQIESVELLELETSTDRS